jgi:hypothetical protein
VLRAERVRLFADLDRTPVISDERPDTDKPDLYDTPASREMFTVPKRPRLRAV